MSTKWIAAQDLKRGDVIWEPNRKAEPIIDIIIYATYARVITSAYSFYCSLDPWPCLTGVET